MLYAAEVIKNEAGYLTRAPPGSPAENASPEGVILPPVIFRTKGRRGTREVAIESSYQDNYNEYIQFY